MALIEAKGGCLVHTIRIVTVINMTDGTGMYVPAHGITGPRVLEVDHVGTEVGIEPGLVGLQPEANGLHRRGVDVWDVVERRKVVFYPPEAMLGWWSHE